jgi:DNA polymerase-3 subunit alpha
MFIPLRVFSPHSVGFGAARAEEIADWCLRHDVPAVGIADRDTLGGVMANAKALSKAGIQLLTGGVFRMRHGAIEGDVVFYATSQAGYSGLLRIANAWNASDHATRKAPDAARIAALAADDARDLIILTGGQQGIVSKLLGADDAQGAAEVLEQLSTTFGSNLYVEIDRGPEGPAPEENALLALAVGYDLPLVATTIVAYADPDMAEAHDAYLCIANKTYLASEDRETSPAGRCLLSPDEMAERFSDLPHAVRNSVEIARRATFMVEPVQPCTPAFPVDAGETEKDVLGRLTRDGMKARLHAQLARGKAYSLDECRTRLDYELGVIAQMGFSGYFLIVADFISWAKAQDIPVGPGRGSGAGSLVAYALGITDIDPMEFGLLFERFLNPDRVSMPDFDIDFCQARRDEVIEYVRGKYGDERVAHIAAFGTLQARAVVRDVGRVMQIPFPVVDRWAKLIPSNPANPVSLTEAMETEALSGDLDDAEPVVQEMFRIALKLEGLHRHVSTHAAGVIISDRPIAEVVPVHLDAHGKLATSFEMKAAEAAGLVKFDFLGLKNLDVIHGAVGFVQETKGQTVDFNTMGFEDDETFEALGAGDGFAVFQLESMGMRKAMTKLGVSDIEELIALISLYRPGPMEQIADYAAVKHGEQDVAYLHPEMREALQPTNGVMIYQEQVMEIARRMGGYSLGEADLLRRAMGKKIKAEMDAQQARFIAGAGEGWVDVETDAGEVRRVHALTKLAALDGSGRRLTIQEAIDESVEVAF